VLNLTFTAEMTPIQIVQALLQKLGLKLKCIKQQRSPTWQAARFTSSSHLMMNAKQSLLPEMPRSRGAGAEE